MLYCALFYNLNLWFARLVQNNIVYILSDE